MDIVIADIEGNDITPLPNGVLELSYGRDETHDDTFTLVVPFDGSLYTNCRVYIEGTEFGGLITDYKFVHDSSGDTIEYSGYSWQGLLSRHIVVVPEGNERYEFTGDNGQLSDGFAKLIKNCGLEKYYQVRGFYDVPIVAEDDDSGIVKLPRYCNLYQAMQYVLEQKNIRDHTPAGSVNATTFDFSYENNQVIIRDTNVKSYEVEESIQAFYTITRALIPVNHLICLGAGKGKDRDVLHLYVDAQGQIGKQQTFTGLLENAEVLDYASASESSDVSEREGNRKDESATKKRQDAERYKAEKLAAAKQRYDDAIAKHANTKYVSTATGTAAQKRARADAKSLEAYNRRVADINASYQRKMDSAQDTENKANAAHSEADAKHLQELANLEQAGREKLKELLTPDGVEVTLPASMNYRVGDIITVSHPSGISVSATVTKKTARVADSRMRISYTVGKDTIKSLKEIKDYS